jgi:hypothetical protein
MGTDGFLMGTYMGRRFGPKTQAIDGFSMGPNGYPWVLPKCICYLRCSESVLAVYHMNNHLTLPGIDVSSHFVSGLYDCSC